MPESRGDGQHEQSFEIGRIERMEVVSLCRLPSSRLAIQIVSVTPSSSNTRTGPSPDSRWICAIDSGRTIRWIAAGGIASIGYGLALGEALSLSEALPLGEALPLATGADEPRASAPVDVAAEGDEPEVDARSVLGPAQPPRTRATPSARTPTDRPVIGTIPEPGLPPERRPVTGDAVLGQEVPVGREAHPVAGNVVGARVRGRDAGRP